MTPLLYTTRRGMQPRASHPRSRKQRRLADNFSHGARVCLLLGLTLKRGFLQDYWLHYSIKLNRTLHQNQQDKMSSDSDKVMITIKRMLGIRKLKNPFVVSLQAWVVVVFMQWTADKKKGIRIALTIGLSATPKPLWGTIKFPSCQCHFLTNTVWWEHFLNVSFSPTLRPGVCRPLCSRTLAHLNHPTTHDML